MNVNSLLPHNSNANVKAETVALVKKWDKTGLLEGLNKEYERSGMAVLLENQAKQLVTEANQTGAESSAEQWNGVALPLVRRIFAEIAAKDFVSVQPMNLPSGLVFFLDFKYTNDFQGSVFNSGAGRTSQTDSVFGVTDANRGTSAPSEGLYGAGRFGYSVNATTQSITIASTAAANTARTGSVAPGTNVYTAGTSGLTQTQFDWFTNYNGELSASIVGLGGTYTILSVATGSLNADLNAVRAFNVTGTGINTVFPEFTRISKDKANIEFLVSGSVSTMSGISLYYSKQPQDTSRGDFEVGNVTAPALDANGKIRIPEIDLQMRSEAIVAKTRKLKAVWTPEFAQDLNAYHSIDAEAELTSMLSEYISQEIDLEILDMLIENAQTTERWSARVGYEYDASTNTFSTANATALAYNQGTWFQTLGTKIQKVSNKIHQLTMRGGANFLVCSPTVATILESIPGYAADTDGNKMQFAMGVQKVGALNSRFQVYKNPYMTENAILLGYRGSQFLETGAVYAPYIPLIMTPLVYDPVDFTPRKGVMTRYAKKMVRPEFYGKIFVDGLQTL